MMFVVDRSSVYGIVSFGDDLKGCGTSVKPGIYTKIWNTEILNWIYRVVEFLQD